MSEMVERVARALFARENNFDGACTWEQECGQEGHFRDYWMDSARAAIEATAEYLDSMGSDTDEDMRALEWTVEIMRSAALSPNTEKGE